MQSSKTNDVTLFSNGIGHFRRVYDAPKEGEAAISIPFKTDSIGDVAASLQVFGKVRLTTPPAFTPANSNATSLSINQREALKSLLSQLSGAAVDLVLKSSDGRTSWTLLGLDTESRSQGDYEYAKDFVIVEQEGSVRRIPLDDVLDVKFTDETVQTEIQKALKTNFQKIKPDSTLLDLTVEPTGDGDGGEWSVQYTIPVAAWKMRYAIREEKGKFTLEGAAIIDNNTDEDWDNFRVSVVTGNPISFNTDIANVVVPTRKFVHLVDRVTLGNVDVEEGMVMAACADPESFGGRAATRGARPRALMAKMSTANVASFGMDACEAEDLEYGGQEAAEAAGVDSKEVGDFCVFSCKEPVTILARKSAVVPMFSVPLSQAGVVLLYKESTHARRPYRAVKFKNETEYSLGRGKTVIYNEGLFSGECVLQTSKPGDNRMLPHCLENGVKIVKDDVQHERRLTSIRVSDSVGITEHVSTAVATYTVENKKNEKFKVALEHQSALGAKALCDFDGVDIKEQEKLTESNGWRIYFELAPNQKLTLKATETRLDRSQQTVGDWSQFRWVQQNILNIDNPLRDDEKIQRCVEIQKQIDLANKELREANQRKNEIESEREGVREDLRAAEGVATGDTLDTWVKEINDAKAEARSITKETIPGLERKINGLQEQLAEALAALSVQWSDKKQAPKEVISE